MTSGLLQVAEVMRHETGISVNAAQLPSLEAALHRVDPMMTSTDFLAASADRVHGRPLVEQMIDEFTIKETFFFRQRDDLDAIDWHSLVRQAHASGSPLARIWVAATASGEEAYTLAILASEAFAPDPPPVLIHATDISTSVLARARQGRYGRRSARALKTSTVSRYFRCEGSDVVVGEQLRRLVSFSRQNLVGHFRPPGDGPFDLITCRNVLIYFEPDVADRVVEELTQSLDTHGSLLLGAADRLCCSDSKLRPRRNSQTAEQRATRPPDAAQMMRRPLGREPHEPLPTVAAVSAAGLSAELEGALRAANRGDLESALEATERALSRDSLDANAYFIRGLALRGLGQQPEAIRAFRSALYVDPGFGHAAFQMGRAHEACRDEPAAVRAYTQALKALDPASERVPAHSQLYPGDVAGACAIRLRALRTLSGNAHMHNRTKRAP